MLIVYYFIKPDVFLFLLHALQTSEYYKLFFRISGK
jgi:hypothetical protein